MKKRKLFLLTVVIIGILFQSSKVCMAAETAPFFENGIVEIGNIDLGESDLQLPLVKKKSKTVKRTYPNKQSIPGGIYYEEYIDGHMWGGILDWTGEIKNVGYGVVEATFSGKLKMID
ncbi:hypothetical protein SAMN05216249_12138 [Acetitomaculum ruminis DSM 5522]|uniref:WG containing repeat-containing protein n=1 Tax=Acetitomaculum ruminis DSM 5522 TaxID=1120918 RepID=A0A1I1A9V2_9FIRM|nr:hypothetical protein [Acetitomaculum ruminis]SFB33163.1 hypothetical protein SAMN05216249_12138 [Acetitomaculum ruminis DSM 5522]